MPVYCEGTNCSKRDTCALHCNIIEGSVYEYIDFSTQGSGSISANHEAVIEYHCGDLGNFKRYIHNSDITQVKIEDIRKYPFENWNHYKYDDYNKCIKCNGKLHMDGQISNYQYFKCTNCHQEFELDAVKDEIKLLNNDNYNTKIYKIDYEVDTGASYITDMAFVKANSPAHAIHLLKEYISSLPNDLSISSIISDLKVVSPIIITEKFGYNKE